MELKEPAAPQAYNRTRRLAVAAGLGVVVGTLLCFTGWRLRVLFGWLPLFVGGLALPVLVLLVATAIRTRAPDRTVWLTRLHAFLIYGVLTGTALVVVRPAIQQWLTERLQTTSVEAISAWRAEHGRLPSSEEAAAVLPERVSYFVQDQGFTIQFADSEDLLGGGAWVYDSETGAWTLVGFSD